MLRRRAHLIARVLAHVRVAAVNVGRRDLAAGLAFLEELEVEFDLPWVSSNLRMPEGDSPFPRWRLLQWGPLQVAVVGVLPEDPIRDRRMGLEVVPPARALKEVLAELPEVDAVICLSTLGLAAERRLVENVPEVQILVGGGSVERLGAPLVIGDTALFHASDRGRYLGVLDASASAFRDWRSPGTVQDEEEVGGRADGVRKTLPGEQSERPGVVTVIEHRLLALSSGVGMDGNVARWVREWKAAAVASRRESAARPRPKPAPRLSPPDDSPPAAYAGSGNCRRCHPRAYQAWRATPHASAYGALRGQPRSARCLGCHATRIHRPSGTSLEPMVGCEACHGPAAAHRGPGDVLRVPTAETCRECHRGFHPDGRFDFDEDYRRIRCDREKLVE